MESIIRIINNHDCGFTISDIKRGNFITFLDFTDYLNLRMVNHTMNKIIKQFVCFNVNFSDYLLYKKVGEQRGFFLYYDNPPKMIERFIEIFEYSYSPIRCIGMDKFFETTTVMNVPIAAAGYILNTPTVKSLTVMKISPLHLHAYFNNIKIFEILAKYDDVNALDINGDTPLNKAIKKRSYDVIRYIINNYEINLNHINFKDETAFIIACNEHDLYIINLLLSKNVDPRKQPKHINWLIDRCIGYSDIVNVLIEYVDVNDTQHLGFTTDHYLGYIIMATMGLHEFKKLEKSVNILKAKFGY